MEKDTDIRVRLPKEIKEKFRLYCDKNLMDMSVRVRQLILEDLKKEEKQKK
jgi:hypothetical protein